MAAETIAFHVKVLTVLVMLTGGGYLAGRCFFSAVSTTASQKSTQIKALGEELSKLKLPTDTQRENGQTNSEKSREKSQLSKDVSKGIVDAIVAGGTFIKDLKLPSADTKSSL